ncbi:MAG TPA: TolC family protein [Longimicrobiales bacterium]|nr:TolC family protein [Longimicrobiales bacterium]
MKSFLRALPLGLALSITALPAGGQEPGVPRLSLDEVIRRAVLHAPAMAQAEGGVRNAEMGRRSATASFLPSLSVSSGASLSSSERFNPTTNTSVTGSNDSYNAGMNASVDLFTGGRKTAELHSARAGLESAEAGAREQRFAVVLSAKQAYYAVLRGGELIRVAEAGVRRAEESLEAARTRLAVGSATRSDVLRGELALNEARQTLLQEENDRRVATFALGRLVGADGPVEAEPVETGAEPLPLEREELLQLALEQSPRVVAAQAGVRSGEAGVRVARAQYFPSLRASSGYNWFNQDPAFTGGRSSWSLGLGVSLPVFNGLQREASIVRSQVQEEVAQAQLADARRQTRADVERLAGAVEVAAQRVVLTREALAMAEEDLRVQRERYRLGATTILELITSENNLIQAENTDVFARYDYQIARAQLEALVGREL